MALPFKRKFFINLILMVIILSSILVFVTYPAIREIKSLSQEIYNYRLHLEKLYLKGQILKNIVEELKKVEPYIEKISKVLIGKNEELGFIVSLEKLADDNQLIQNLKIDPAQKIDSNNYKIMPVQIALQGDFTNLIKYLIELNKLDYYINIKNLSIQKIGKTSQINIFLEANTYGENNI
ncbi:MAG: Uncharacterized protein Athens101410_232 [Parcubacteria group bacterium Athens1014_10]|nr:MAG: Uncharacterized protein Athens101410_232 [Parcubacteria group bacterium Athens1014_10]TSD04752.1 MAG: Uncharacterized protein Athens071412_627 [Parcubacteria group bacterium Athens0714_12]